MVHFVLFEQKYGIFDEDRASERLRGCSEARFPVFRAKNLVYFCLYFTEIKYTQRNRGGRI